MVKKPESDVQGWAFQKMPGTIMNTIALSHVAERRAPILSHYGRLVRVNRGGQRPVAYIVAIKEPLEAIRLIKKEVAPEAALVEDVGRVSDALLRTIGLNSGGYVRADRLCR
jgi:hypothetical protein